MIDAHSFLLPPTKPTYAPPYRYRGATGIDWDEPGQGKN